MAISDREFYAAHGLNMDFDKMLQEYTRQTSLKVLLEIENEILSVFIANEHTPTSACDKLKLTEFIKGLKAAQRIIDKHISDLISEVSTDEEPTENSGTESSDAI